jgi:UDP-N-acetylmuramoyl-tripeptide--D-alanyl-D-alanine ligase
LTARGMTLAAAARAMKARYAGPDRLFASVSTDTRTVAGGELFFAIRGERFDGADFVADAIAHGAAAAVVASGSASRVRGVPGERLVIVDDARLALGRLGAHWRERFTRPLLALTGSNGKTTVKEMIAAILAVASGGPDRVLATLGNLNNDLGVPLTLLRLAPEHRYGVVELGMNHAGEIHYLAQLASPDVALVNNAGTAHLENLGSREAIARAKGEVFENLRANGIAIINADDRFAPMWRELAGARRQLCFGVDQPADVRGRYTLRDAGSVLDLETPSGPVRIELSVPGEHNARNALAAAASAVSLGIDVEAIASGLSAYHGMKGRLQRMRGARGASLIDDTYNANPDSVQAAIGVLAAVSGLRILVLGDMGELGSAAAELHAEVGASAKAAGIEALYTLGRHAAQAAQAFGVGACHGTSVEDLVAAIGPRLGPRVTVLVKGSRFMQMERLVAELAAAPASAPDTGA